jgi:hypothetical protein
MKHEISSVKNYKKIKHFFFLLLLSYACFVFWFWLWDLGITQYKTKCWLFRHTVRRTGKARNHYYSCIIIITQLSVPAIVYRAERNNIFQIRKLINLTPYYDLYVWRNCTYYTATPIITRRTCIRPTSSFCTTFKTMCMYNMYIWCFSFAS